VSIDHQTLPDSPQAVFGKKEMQILLENLTIDWRKVCDSLQTALGENEMKTQYNPIGTIDRINLEKTSDSIISCANGLKAAVILAQNAYLGSVKLSLGDPLHQEQVKDGIFDILVALIEQIHDDTIILQDDFEMQTRNHTISPIDRINLEKTSDSILSRANGLKAAVILAQNAYLGSIELSLGDPLDQEQVENGIFDILVALIDRLHDDIITLQDDLGIWLSGSESEN
jgi:hypothetical protein